MPEGASRSCSFFSFSNSQGVMRDVHSLTGGGPPAERLFVAATAAAGDRRLQHPSNQNLKCPRCDSPNTKFCYYNNYNLSQPRHFCKSCRRYWTKGGVLRNVPVGGGCRKSKRSSSTSSSSSSKSSSPKPAPPSLSLSAAESQQPHNRAADATATDRGNHSSSDSSMIPAIPPLFHGYGPSCVEKPPVTRASSLYGFEDIVIDPHHGGGDGGRDDMGAGMLMGMGNFPSLIGSTAKIAPLGDGGLMSQHGQEQQQDMVVVEGFGPLDWEGSGGESNGGDRGERMFELTGSVDHAYWSQQNHWTAADDVLDHHHNGGGGLFLP